MVVDEKRIGKYKIEVIQDESPSSPREDDNLGTMVCFHNRYDLGDEHNYKSGDYNGWDEMEKNIIKNENVGVILPLYLYDHSGITISTSPFSCNWDSGQIGFIFISKEKMLKEYGGKIVTQTLKDKVEGYLKSEVETYDQYLTGDVYGYRVSEVKTCSEGHEHEEELDSCWGYYGQENCMLEGVGIVDYLLEKGFVQEHNEMI
jgi:hypothetical protein